MRHPLLKLATWIVLLALLAAGALDCGRRSRTASVLAPRYGTLVVRSDPPGARILVDGADYTALTPDDFTLTAGAHTVSVSLAGHTYSPPTATVSVVAGTSIDYTFLEYAPRLEPDTTSHAFGLQALDVSSALWCCTVTNRGRAAADSGAFTLSGSDAGQFAILSGGAYRGLAPGASQQVCVAFTPASPGMKHASIAVGAMAVSLTGTGYKVPCTLAATASAHDFGAQDVGGAEPSWCFDLRNDEPSACGDTVRLGGNDPGDFAILSGAVYDLGPGASQTVCVAFRPRGAGARAATLIAGTVTVALSGSGVGSCDLGSPTTPDGTDFGIVCTNAGASKRLVIANTGNLPCTVNATGCEAVVVSPATAIVPPRGATTFNVAFQPSDPGVVPPCPVTLSDGTHQWTTSFSGTAIAAPTVDFTPSGGIVAHSRVAVPFVAQVLDNGSPITSYLWDFGDNFTSTEPQIAHAYGLGGTYTVSLTVTNACGGSSTAVHTICIDELAYVQIYGFDSSTVPDYTTNIPGWGSLVPLVLYRGLNASYSALPARVCLNVTTGELLNAKDDRSGAPQPAYEALGTTGQSFATAHLPVASQECSVTGQFSIGAIFWATFAPAFYWKVGGCGHDFLGLASGDPRSCVEFTNTFHCPQTGGDGRLEWGLETPVIERWASVNSIRFTFNCWYVCPGSRPQTGPMRVVDPPRGGARP